MRNELREKIHGALKTLFFSHIAPFACLFARRTHLPTDPTHAFHITSRTLVASRSPDQPLVLQVLRGSSAWDDHERALTDLCSNVDDEKVEQCIAAFMQDAYDDDHNMENTSDDDDDSSVIAVGSSSSDDKTTTSSGTEEEAAAADTLIDSMYNMWAAELPTTPPPAPVDEETTSAPKIKPWSVRSSPSGTYVRDPVTGEMKNITQ
jgi:hypothetical protein